MKVDADLPFDGCVNCENQQLQKKPHRGEPNENGEREFFWYRCSFAEICIRAVEIAEESKGNAV